MAIADLFKKKKEEPQPPAQAPYPAPDYPEPMPPSEVPVSDVLSMQESGLTNNQIIQSLQRQGYNPQQIYDALAQAEAKKSVEPMRQPEYAEPSESVESVAEQVVDEKMQEFHRHFTKLNEWKDKVDSRLDKFEQEMQDLRADLEGLHKAIVDRVSDYDKTLTDVGTEIKAMEKVFQKVLPELTSNVQELSRITKSKKGS